METATLARPYARAAFELAHDDDAFDAWSGHLDVAAAIAADPRMAGLGNDPQMQPAELARMHRPDGVDDAAPFARFLAVMADNRRLALLPQVVQQFDALRRACEHTVKVHLLCAGEPGPEQVNKLTEALRTRVDSRIELETDVDPSILGGAIISIDDQVIDGSARAQLRQLQSDLTN